MASHKRIFFKFTFISYKSLNSKKLLSNSTGLEAADPIRRSDMRNNDAIFTRTLEVVQPALQH